MNINILRYSLFGIAGGQEVDRNFSYIETNLEEATDQVDMLNFSTPAVLKILFHVILLHQCLTILV